MEPGTTFAGRYVIEEEAGRGGMSVVFRAVDTQTDSPVALKVISEVSVVDFARFQREAALLEALNDPSVVGYVSHGSCESRHYIAMEWLEGLSVEELPTPIDVETALEIARGALRGLSAAHALGVVHRDVKPSNLFLVDGRPDQVKVIDLGIARATQPGHTVTQAGTVVGTPHFMAPEQARADTGVDARADLYSLGAVLYWLLSGKLPFDHPHLMALLASILFEEPTSLDVHAPSVPRSVTALVSDLLAKAPSDRPADAAALLARLDAVTSTTSAPRTERREGAITRREQRVLCLVLLATQDELSPRLDATLASDSKTDIARLRDCVGRFGGYLEVLADGSSVARMDRDDQAGEQAVRAARCALALRNLAPDLPLAVVAGRGSFEGPLPVGEVVERGTALLGAPHEPSPAETSAAPVPIDETMRALLSGRFTVSLSPNGAQLGAMRPSTPSPHAGARTRFVGRRRELGTLKAVYEECVEDPVARAVLITGATGLGKTRLIRELFAHIEVEDTWTARGDPIAAESAYGILGQLVRSGAGMEAGDALPDRREKLLQSLRRALPTDSDERILSRAALLGDTCRTPFQHDTVALVADPRLRGDALREAWLAWVEGALTRGPLALVIDDLQWADPASIAVVDATLRTNHAAALFVVGAGHPKLTATLGTPWAEREVLPIPLARIRPRAAHALLDDLLAADAPSWLVEHLVDHADGNPFFLEELARASIHTELSEAELRLPATVLGLVEARIASLPPETRRVLRAASVFGRRFHRRGVVALLGGEGDAVDVDPHLATLEERGFIEPTGGPNVSDEPELAFRQLIVREAALAMLTEDDRSLGHRLAGRWLVEQEEREAGVLAAHFEQAGAWTEAGHWMVRAAEASLAADDLPDAVSRATRAMAHVTPEDAVAAHLCLATAYRWQGRYSNALEHSEAALAGAMEGTGPWLQALGTLFAAGGQLGRAELVESWRGRALKVDVVPALAGRQAEALARAATTALAAGAMSRFEETMRRAEELTAAAPADLTGRAWVLTLRSSEAQRNGDYGAFIDGTAEAIRMYEAGGDLRDASNQRVRLGSTYLDLGAEELGIEQLQAALDHAQRMGLPLIEAYALQNLGRVASSQGRLQNAIRLQAQAIRLAEQLSDPILEAGCLLYLTEAQLASDLIDEAAEAADKAVRLLNAVPGFRAVALAYRSRVALSRSAPAEALRDAEDAIEEARAEAVPEGEATVELAYLEALLANARDITEAASAARRRLEARAAEIQSPTWRHAFLTNVPTHLRILQLGSVDASQTNE